MRGTVTVVVLTALASLAACSGGNGDSASSVSDQELDLAEIERLAKDEGQVVWYGASLQTTADAVAAAFEDRYGIEVVYPGRFASSDLGAKVLADVRNTGAMSADVILDSADGLPLYLREEGITRPLTGEVLDVLFGDFPEEFTLGDAAAMCQIQVPVIAYNTEVLGDFVPGSWDDLLDPRLAGQIMVPSPAVGPAWLKVWSVVLNDPDLGEDYIEKIAAQGIQPVGTSLIAAEQLIAGQGAVQLAGIPILFEPAIAEGKPVDYFVPEDPSPVSPSYCALGADTPHPNAGFLFLHWLLSEEGQTVLNAAELSASPLGGLPGAFPMPDDYTFPPSDEQLRNELPAIAEPLGFN